MDISLMPSFGSTASVSFMTPVTPPPSACSFTHPSKSALHSAMAGSAKSHSCSGTENSRILRYPVWETVLMMQVSTPYRSWTPTRSQSMASPCRPSTPRLRTCSSQRTQPTTKSAATPPDPSSCNAMRQTVFVCRILYPAASPCILRQRQPPIY